MKLKEKKINDEPAVMHLKRSGADIVADVIIYAFIVALSLICILPFIQVFAVSVSSNAAVMAKSVFLIPKGFTWAAYKDLFVGDSNMVQPLVYTTWVTVAFTALGMFLTICGAFALSRPRLKGRKIVSVLFLITMYFYAGTIPDYLLMKTLNLLNNPLVLILPLAFSAYNLIILRTFMQNSVPASLEEAASVDGCSDIGILIKVILPLCLPVLATLALFYAVGRWNSFQDSIYFMTRQNLKTLQHRLNDMIAAANVSDTGGESGAGSIKVSEVIQSASIIFTTLPILLVYPFLQKYFVTGVMIGAVKE